MTQKVHHRPYVSLENDAHDFSRAFLSILRLWCTRMAVVFCHNAPQYDKQFEVIRGGQTFPVFPIILPCQLYKDDNLTLLIFLWKYRLSLFAILDNFRNHFVKFHIFLWKLVIVVSTLVTTHIFVGLSAFQQNQRVKSENRIEQQY